MVMLNHLAEYIRFPDGRMVEIGGEERSQPQEAERIGHFITEFRLENHLPVWRYEVEGIVLEKHVLFLYGQNTVHISYRLLSKQENVWLELRPSMHFRGHDQAVNDTAHEVYRFSVTGDQYEVLTSESAPRLRMVIKGDKAAFTYDGGTRREIFYQKEADRGYEARGSLWSPGYFSVNLHGKREATLIASTEWWHTMLALTPDEALEFYHGRHRRMIASAPFKNGEGASADLVLAADQFVITPAGRIQDAARAHAAGDEVRTVIAGYHWFTDWGRDTMISLEGLALTTNRHTEAGWILRTFAYYIRDGLLPNLFPEGQNQGLYHTADATLWFFHALDRYVETTKDLDTLKLILPKLVDVVEHHVRGTRFGIKVDAADGLLSQGAPGYQLTWMDAKVDDWVVTPRRGKAVEINGLWYNALKLMEGWQEAMGDKKLAQRYSELAERAKKSFNLRFWNEKGKFLYDIVDGEYGDDCSCRPNQLLAFSLKHPVLDKKYWKPVLETVQQRLLTPVGLRTLSRDHADYKPKILWGPARARRGVSSGHSMGLVDRSFHRCLAESASGRAEQGAEIFGGL